MESDKIQDYLFFKMLLNRLNIDIFIIDASTEKIIFMNHTMKKGFGIEDPEGENYRDILDDSVPEVKDNLEGWQAKMKSGCQICVQTEQNRMTGKIYKKYMELQEYNSRVLYIQSMIDITEYSKSSEQASIDALTEILNRRAGKVELENCIRKARRERKVVTVALYDINGLKHINETYGYKEGDSLLRFIASVSKKVVQSEDSIFRLSGDEFVIVFYNERMRGAEARIQDILCQLKEKREQYAIQYSISFSYGLAEIYPGDCYSASEIISKADAQMYIKKRDYHIRKAKQELFSVKVQENEALDFEYDKEHLYDALIASTDDYIFVGNIVTGVIRYSPAMVEEFGLPGQVIDNAAAFWTQLVHPHDEKYFLESNQEIMDGRAESHNIEYRAKNAKGDWIWLRCRGKLVRNAQGEPSLFAGFITNLGRKNQIDHMTGLYNRFIFEGDIKTYVADGSAGRKMGVMLLDMDAFHNVNDLYNRSFGDEVLRVTAQKIAAILPEYAKIYRLDGDEFGIILMGGEREECYRIYKQIRGMFSSQQEYGGKKYYCTLSGGYVCYPEDAQNYLDLLKYANYSLEVSKNAGKNRLTSFSRRILQAKERKLELTELLRESIERGFQGFQVYYQPQTHTMTRELYGAEALARYRCEKYGEVSPAEFIPLLEQNGMITYLGSWIFRKAAEQCLQWNQIKPGFHMSINLSYLQLLEGDIVGEVGQTLERIALNPQNITMELTETYLAKADTAILHMISTMRKTGIQIAMDDFGTGYSLLPSLKSIPVDVIKIDKAFAKNITQDIFNTTFVHVITELCHGVGKRVCLEGVETEEEYNTVKDIGPELIQGFYFGKPIAPEEFVQKFLASDF